VIIVVDTSDQTSGANITNMVLQTLHNVNASAWN